MSIVVYQNGITLQGKMGEIIAYLKTLPGDVPLHDYVHLNLH